MNRTDVKKTNKAKSPIKYYINYSAGTGTFKYWNGTENVELDNLDLVLVKTMSSVTGWYDGKGEIRSNLVESTKDPMTVWAGKEKVLSGLWSDIKAVATEIGGSFTINLICLANIGGEFVPCNLQLKKSALRSWMAFLENTSIFEVFRGVLSVVKGEQLKKGSVKYYPPTFSLSELPEDLEEKANHFDLDELKPYLSKFATPEDKNDC